MPTRSPAWTPAATIPRASAATCSGVAAACSVTASGSAAVDGIWKAVGLEYSCTGGSCQWARRCDLGREHTERMVCMLGFPAFLVPANDQAPRRVPVQSTLYEAEHDAFRAMLRDFLAKEVVPHHAAWEEAGVVDRSVWLKAGEQGLLGMDVPEEYGGGGGKDFRYNAVLATEGTRG